MQLSSADAKVWRKAEDFAIMLEREQHGILGESQIITDTDAKVAEICLEDRELWGTGHHKVGLVEHDSIGDVHIEKVELAVHSPQITFPIEA